jgi:hypothetical protein
VTGLTLPAAAGVSDQTVAFAAGLIDRSGKAPVIEAALAHRTGRRRPLPVRAVLTALPCLALDDRPLFLTEATGLLYHQISDGSRHRLCAASRASPAVSRRSPRPWHLCYTRCYMVSNLSQPQTSMRRPTSDGKPPMPS